MILSHHPMLAFWQISSYGGVGTSRVDREYISCERCPACERWHEEKAYKNAKIWVDGRGSRWPDILTCLGLLIIHERVVKTITEAGLTGFIAHPVEIVEVKIKKLAEQSLPKYYLIEITGKMDVDPNELDDVGGSLCPLCFSRNCTVEPYQFRAKRVMPKLETWDGSDFVRTRNWSTGMHYCTRAFVDLACKNRWTNFVFGYSMPGVTMWSKSPEEGDLSYCDPDWFEKTAERVKAKNPDLFE